MARLWKNNPDTPEGKYLIKRRDGTVPKWPFFVIGGADAVAPVALRAYADEAERVGLDPEYVSDIRAMALEFEVYRATVGHGDPDASRHRQDDPATVAEMAKGRGA